MSDLRQRVPGHSLIDQLLHQWDVGAIHFGATPNEVVIDDEALGWYRGVIGERRVADLLAQLGDGWTVLHSLPAGAKGRDIDHLVIGQPGVFTINTKYSPGKDVWSKGFGVYVGGHPQKSFIPAVLTEVAQAEEALSRVSGLTVPVTGLLAFVDPRRVDRRAPAGNGVADVRVVTDRELLATLRGRAVFSVEQVEQIVAAASLPETWLLRPQESTIGEHIAREFEALEAAVNPYVARSSPRTAPTREPRRSTTPRRPKKRRERTLEKLIQMTVVTAVGFGVIWFCTMYLLGK
jgi:hypothetical protein